MPGSRVLERLLTRIAGAQLADSILGDLEEGRIRRAQRSRLGAGIWLFGSALRVAGYMVAQRAGSALISSVRRGVMERLTSDLRQTIRAAARRPTATLALVLVLSLGVGLTSAMFALADPFLLRPLPYRDPDQLVEVTLASNVHDSITQDAVLPTFDQWRQRTDLFTDLAAWSHFTREAHSLDGVTEELSVVRVSGNFFTLLGHEEAETAGWPELTRTRQPVVALTDRGQRKSQARVGQTLKDSNDAPRQVAAALSPEFLFPGTIQSIDGLIADDPGPVIDVQRWSSKGTPSNSQEVILIGRLAPGVSPSQVAAALSWTTASGRTVAVEAIPLRDEMTRRVRPLAQGALAAGALILLVCIGNVANLLIARSAYRTREMATRAALGASRLALTRMAAVESLAIAAAGTVLGLVVAWLALRAAGTVIPDEYTSLGAPTLTARVVLFAMTAGLSVTLLAAIPAWLARRVKPGAVFGRHGSGDAPRVRPIRFIVTAVQSALAVVLVIGAGLLLTSYAHLVSQEAGFDRDVLAVTVVFPPGRSDPALQAEVDAAIAELRRLPGVQHVAASVGSMIDLSGSGTLLTVDGKAASTNRKAVSPEFFDTTGLRIIAGRPLQMEDKDETGVVVNRAFVRKHWPDGRGVGRTVGFGRRPVPIVGVVDDAFDVALDTPPEPTVFVLLHNRASSRLSFMIRTDQPADALRLPIQRALAAASPGIAIREYSTVAQRLSHTVRDRSFATLMLTFFALAALAVSTAGVISVVMTIVSGRTREIAVRMAIGAQRGHVRWLVVREALWAAAAGAAGGVFAGQWLSRGLESLVYGIEASSWLAPSLAASVAVLLMAAAALVPARGALRLEPTEALRCE